MIPSEIEVGMRVYWCDPDDGTCSGYGKVTAIDVEPGEVTADDTIIAVELDHGGEADCYAHELTPEDDIRK